MEASLNTAKKASLLDCFFIQLHLLRITSDLRYPEATSIGAAFDVPSLVTAFIPPLNCHPSPSLNGLLLHAE